MENHLEDVKKLPFFIKNFKIYEDLKDLTMNNSQLIT